MSEASLVRNEVNDMPSFTEAALNQAQNLIDSKLLPQAITTPQQALIIIEKGKELGFKPMQSFDMIDVIMGKPTLKPKAKSLMALKSGKVWWKTIQDWQDVVDQHGAVIDKVTLIRFYRNHNGTIVEDDTKFSWSEANTMGYLGKDNWKKQPAIMAYWRCLSRGLDRVCPDLTGGLYMSDEMADVHNVKYDINQEGDFEIINEQ